MNTLDKVHDVAEVLGVKPTFIAVWKDFHYDSDDHDGKVDGFETPELAFEYARVNAESHGFTGISYWVAARVGNFKSGAIKGFEGRT